MFPISINKYGISFRVFGEHKDTILVRWPFIKKPIIHSYSYDRDFNRIRDYLKYHYGDKSGIEYEMVCSDSGKIVGVSFENLFRQWVSATFPNEYVVALRNIDLSVKSEDFWLKLSRDKITPFIQKEFVVLRCKDKSSTIRLMSGIPPEFADAVAFENGIPIPIDYRVYYESHKGNSA